jgi:hypothetical protein
MSLYIDLHAEWEMSILDRSYGGLEGRVNVDFLVLYCRSLCRARLSILSMVLSMWCRCGGLRVDRVELLVDYYVEDNCCSRFWAQLATERSSSSLYKLGMALL